MTPIQVGILLFEEIEVLDFAGPFEVFSLAEKNNTKLFNVHTIGESESVIHARNGLKVVPNFNIQNHPKLDILIIPGGYGAEEITIKNNTILNWIKDQYQKVEIMASVCTGALLLAECGILDYKKATTHWMDIDRLENEYPNVTAVRNTKFVDEGNLITSGGISAGINMSFHLVKKLFDHETAELLAKRMVYDIEL
ncbi:DJ-1/PfpI family protein [Limibacter armeniacum]|uniref:DJ-1/PfpI family protein n=1 Tax=Limibacter armeniacum TaxID=466084 RepID=UPI002FE6A252